MREFLPKRGDNILAKDFAMLRGTDPMPEIISRKGNSRFMSFRKTINFGDYGVIINEDQN